MKVLVKINLKVHKQTEEFDGNFVNEEKDVWVSNEKALTVTKSNVKRVMQSQKESLDAKFDNINEITGGSGWQIKKYTRSQPPSQLPFGLPTFTFEIHL